METKNLESLERSGQSEGGGQEPSHLRPPRSRKGTWISSKVQEEAT